MAGLQSLPNDLLIDIVRRLSVDRDKDENRSSRALCALSLCSRRFHHISQAFLYKNITLYKNSNVLKLIRRVLFRPDVASLVQSMEVHYYGEERRDLTLQQDFNGGVRTNMYQICQSARMAEQWLEDLPTNRRGASVAFLLLLIPNLTNLVISFFSSLDYVTTAAQLTLPFKSDIGSDKQVSQPQFPRLVTLELVGDSFTRIQFQPLLRLVSLRKFRANLLTTDLWNIYPGISFLHELEVNNCEMDEEHIFPLLEACNELRKFTFRWDQPWSNEDVRSEGSDEGIDVGPWIINGLQHNKATLEVLDLSGRQPIRDDTMSLGDLTNFHRLHTLRVPAAMVINPDSSLAGERSINMLPESLKTLHLIFGEELKLLSDALDCIRCEKWGLALQVLTITSQLDSRFYHVSEVAAMVRYQLLKVVCESRGIVFRFEQKFW